MTNLDDVLSAFDAPNDDALVERALSALIGVTDAATLDDVAARADERTSTSPARLAALRMVAGAAHAKASLLRGAVATGTVDEIVAALNALVPDPDAAKFGPLGAYLLDKKVPTFVEMRVATDPDDEVFCWASGAMALRERARR